jgi:DNA-binding transcriptional MocR family regulator
MSVSCVEVKHSIPAAVEWAIKIRDGMRGSKRGLYRETLLVMATYVNRRGECFPSIRTLAAALGLTYDGMRRRIRSMTRMGLIRTIARRGDNGRQTSNGYVITLTCQSTPPGTVAYRDNITPEGKAGG